MSRARACCFAVLFALFAAASVWADIARPNPPQPTPEPNRAFYESMTITPDASGSYLTLEIPKETLLEMSREIEGNERASFTDRVAHSSTRTIVAGLFLSLSLVLGGLWLARTNARRTHKAVGLALLLAVVAGAATVITRANIGPPPYYSWRNLPQNLTSGKATSGSLKVIITPSGSNLKLTVPVRNTKPAGNKDEE